MARAARKAKAKPAGKRAPASGKQRKYSRDNNGRFASTGTGATARGGRLLTAKGNKRKTQTITAVGKKGVIGKPKGLKPGGLANSAAKRREANSVRKGNRVLTTDADRRSRSQSLARAERTLAEVKASPGKGRDRLFGSDNKLKAAQAQVDGLKKPMPSSRKVNRSAQAAANRTALAVKRSEQRNGKTMADFVGSKPAAAKPAAAKPAAAKPAAKKPAAKPAAPKAVKASETQRNIRLYMDQNRGSVARDMKRDAQAFRQPLAKKDQKPGGPKTVGGALEALATKSFSRVSSKTALTSDESAKAQKLISDNNIKGYRVTRTSRGDILERTSGVSSRAAVLGEAAAGRKATRKPATRKPAAAKPAAAPAAAKKRVRTDGAAFAERNKRTSRTEIKRSLAESDKDNALTSEQRRKTPVAKRMAQAEEKTARARRTAAAAKEFYRNYGSDSTFGRRPRLSTAGGAKFGAKVKAKKPAAAKPAAAKPAVSARGRTAPKPAARTTPSSADGKLSFRTRGKAVQAQRARNSATQEKTSSQVIGARRGVRRTAASGHRSEKIAVTKVSSKQGNLLTGKTDTTKHVKARIVARNGGPSIGSKSARRSFGVMTRKMETPRSNRGRKQNRLRGLEAARQKKSPYDKKKMAKTIATRGKALKYYDKFNKLY